ncbi:FAD-linked sulfhydryl oxidase ALR-like [Rhipicephalus sanguineus]|uniref:FAD-linked sulfhydryl oxidase ALR-like n=1 Tax=Rhipicephalus sanguineus TaxID=34632 RepID=UPI00189600F0|nr:FAD-linked sulfhydryl oxidase ALR-like [Rhipicephalus sanguineus]
MAAPRATEESYDEDYDYRGGRRKKPCRACSDFKAWAKSKGGTPSKAAGPSQAADAGPSPERECPPDRSELGRCTWSLLHSVAAYYPKRPSAEQQRDAEQFFRLFARLYPCKECAQDFRTELDSSPPRVTSRTELAQWLCEQHNVVNRKLGKPEFDCSRVDERWRRGWDDGSCS